MSNVEPVDPIVLSDGDDGNDDEQADEANVPVEASNGAASISRQFEGTLSKWTNFIHGWQERFMVLRDGTLSYYKSKNETDIGCRGAISIQKAAVKVH
jgi:hypothetical protein